MNNNLQHWEKIGCIFKPDKSTEWMNSHASVPLVTSINNNSAEIIFSVRNTQGKSLPASLKLNLKTMQVDSISTKPLFLPGVAGSFDEDGIMPTCIIRKGNNFLLYYIGWNIAKTVPFRNSIGLALSHDKCKTFVKKYSGPIIDRNIYDPLFVASCDVLKEKQVYKMWYLSCLKWDKTQEGNYKHYYVIKFAESNDGVNWKRDNKVAINYKYPNEYAISVPRVIKEHGKYKMWYSYRGGPISETYRVGYAESDNGLNWTRMDELVNLDVAQDGWDSEMICYPFIFDHSGKRYMLYNGNGYGKTGFGIAVLKK
jgi:hypothetical protein